MIQLIPAFSQRSRELYCSICGRGPGKENPNNPVSSDRPVVTLGVAIEMEGEFDICVDCAAEIGSVVDMISADDADELKAAAAASEDALLEAQDALEKSRAATDALAAEVTSRG